MEQAIDIRALKTGDERAFRSLVEAYQDRVFNTCLGFLETREEAEDATQETFVEVFSSIGRFREEAKLSTWIYRIAVSKSLEAVRKKKRKKRFAFFLRGEENSAALESASDSDGRNHPLAQIENKEHAEALYAALSALPESQRTAFTLHKIEGLKETEIGEVMKISTASVESLIHRAAIKLRELLNEYYRSLS
jgi:RNA polymerase sigma-70 factor (ECF subfamily)